MDKNTLTGLVLMGLLIFGFMWMRPKPDAQEQQAQEQAEAKANEEAKAVASLDSITSAEAAAFPILMREVGAKSGANDSTATFSYKTDKVNLTFNGKTVSGTVAAIDTVIPYEAVVNGTFGEGINLSNRNEAVANLRAALEEAQQYGSFARYRSGSKQSVSLKNSKLDIEISNLGGCISKATLLDYKTYLPESDTSEKIDTADVQVCREGYNSYSFELTSATRRFNTGELYFTPVQVNDSVVEMKLDLGGGSSWGIRYTLPEDSYIVKMEVIQEKMDKIIPSSVSTATFAWAQKMGRNERGRTFEQRNSGLYYKYTGDSPEDLAAQGEKHKELNQRLKWIAYKNQFFSMVMIPRTYFSSAEVSSVALDDDPTFVKDLASVAIMDYNATEAVPMTFDIFMGPNLYPLLDHLDKEIPGGDENSLQLTKLIPLGWSLFRWINTLIIIPVFTFLGKFITSYGLIIFLLTIFIKVILFPFTYKSLKSQAKMRLLAPEIKEINDKYPGQENAMTRNQKTMELYSRAGASPMSGCIPMLLQMPVLIAMFWFFPSAIELRGEHFLWAKDLSAPDYIFTLPFSIPWYGRHVSLFCLLMTVTNIVYTRLNMQSQNNSGMPGMKWMMYLMPVMFLFIFNDYAAGLSYYYFLSLLITIAMTYAFRLFTNEDKMRAQMKANAAKPKKKSGFMARLEEAQRKQQAILREQQKKGRK